MFNVRYGRLTGSTLGERVTIVERHGTVSRARWRGFLVADTAKANPTA